MAGDIFPNDSDVFPQQSYFPRHLLFTAKMVAELEDEIQEFREEAERISQYVVPEESPKCKTLWEDYMKGSVIPEGKKDVCILLPVRHGRSIYISVMS